MAFSGFYFKALDPLDRVQSPLKDSFDDLATAVIAVILSWRKFISIYDIFNQKDDRNFGKCTK